MTVSHLLSSISSKELSEWAVYYELEPFGEERDDLRMGVISSTIANVNRSKNSKVYKPQDFIPKFGEQHRQTWQQQLKAVEVINQIFHGEDLRKEKIWN